MRLLLGVSGGIAAYKALELARLATLAGHAVRVIQTASAQRFVGAASFEGITGAPVLVDEWAADPARGAFPDQPQPDHAPISHLALVANADVLAVAPATANTIARLAHGLADDLLTASALAATCPVVVAPAMNNHMYLHAATQANIATLRARGVTVLDPGVGALGSRGEHGIGRLPEPAELLAELEALASSDATAGAVDGVDEHLVGLRVLVTAGGTREAIDSVRYIGNRSSGRMGFALAEEAARRGAEVTVVAANVTLPRRSSIAYIDVETATELRDACLTAFDDCDLLLMAAAVSDFRPQGGSANEKLSRTGMERLTLELEPTDDVVATLARRRRDHQTLVGFAAEHGDGGRARARVKLDRKGLDLVVLNDISQPGIGFDSVDNEVVLVGDDGDVPLARASKTEIAAGILDAVERLRSN